MPHREESAIQPRGLNFLPEYGTREHRSCSVEYLEGTPRTNIPQITECRSQDRIQQGRQRRLSSCWPKPNHNPGPIYPRFLGMRLDCILEDRTRTHLKGSRSQAFVLDLVYSVQKSKLWDSQAIEMCL